MKGLEDLNRRLNRALRMLNEIAIVVASSPLADRKLGLDESAQALAHLMALQRLVVTHDPGLEYHYDPNREPSSFMREIATLVKQAEALIDEGRIGEAVEVLERAREMEPPPLTYEMITKTLDSLRKRSE